MKSAIFAGGCFWCIEHDFRELDGVSEVVSGYTGGRKEDATYEKVSLRKTSHREVVKVSYGDSLTFKKLCQFFLDHIDPTDSEGQFADRGENYKTAIYYKTDEEKSIALALLTELDESKLYDKKVAVDVLLETEFFPAEEYHQQYADKNLTHYYLYRQGSGRENFVNKTCAIREEKKINWKD